MERVFFAIGHREIEEYIKGRLKDKVKFVGEAVYREGIIKGIAQTSPSVAIIRETLNGSTNILEIVYKLRNDYPNVRIIFMAGKRVPGDALLSEMVNLGVYDILTSDNTNVSTIIDMIFNKRTFKDVSYLKVKTIVDESNNKKIFEAPDPKNIEIIKTIYMDDSAVGNSTKKNIKSKVEGSTVDNDINIDDKLKKIVEISQSSNEIKKEKKIKKPIGSDKIKGILGKKETSDLKEIKEFKSTRQKIITFMGARNGVGTTQIAFNTAIHLSKKGYKVVYMEINDKSSTIDYLYQLGFFDKGIDKAIDFIKKSDYQNVDESIISIDKVMKLNKSEGYMMKNYKKFPKDLYYMFFSQDYITAIDRHAINEDGLKELCIYLLLQKEYDFIILDIDSDVRNKLTELALNLATKIFFTITQDVSIISSNIAKQALMDKNRINYKDKFYYIINKFEDANLSVANITEWIQKEITASIPNLNREFIDANYYGLPIVLLSKNRELHKAFSNIEKIIFS